MKHELKKVFWSEDDVITVGSVGVVRMFIAADGNGLSGAYDRIHVLYADGRHQIYPAHNVEGFELVESWKENAA